MTKTVQTSIDAIKAEIEELKRQGTIKGSVQPFHDGAYYRLVWVERGKVKTRAIGNTEVEKYRAMVARSRTVQRLERLVAKMERELELIQAEVAA